MIPLLRLATDPVMALRGLRRRTQRGSPPRAIVPSAFSPLSEPRAAPARPRLVRARQAGAPRRSSPAAWSGLGGASARPPGRARGLARTVLGPALIACGVPRIPFLLREVERLELRDGYVLRDARVHGEIGEMRAFAIEPCCDDRPRPPAGYTPHDQSLRYAKSLQIAWSVPGSNR